MPESLLSSYINGSGFDPRNPDNLLKALSYFYQDLKRVNNGAGGLPLAPGTGVNSIIKDNNTGNTASGVDGIALGDGCTASGRNSFSLGFHSVASGTNSVAIGTGTIASGVGSFAAGENSEAAGEDSACLGVFNYAGASDAFVQGSGCAAYGGGSHAEGSGTEANGENSHAEGGGSRTFADNSRAEGIGCDTMGNASKAYGKQSISIFDFSTAFASGGFGQRTEHMLNNRTTDATPAILYIDYDDNTKELDAASVGVNIFWDFEARMIAVDDGTGISGVAGAVRAITLKGIFSKTAGIIGTPIEMYNDGSASSSTWTFVPSAAGTTLQFTITTQADKNINCTCYVTLVQIAY